MKPNVLRSIALVASVAFGACGETGPGTGELTETEAEDLAEVVMVAAFASGTSSLPATSGPQQAPYEYEETISGDVPCTLGGVVHVNATLVVSGDTETTAESVSALMTQLHDGCRVVSSREREFTLEGVESDPLTLDLLVESNGLGVIEMDAGISGVIDWYTEGRDGRCEIAVEFGARLEGESLDAQMTGTVCGFDVTRSLAVG